MRNKIIETIKKYDMLGGSDNIVVAVSGGADSMCLLHFLYGEKNKLGINKIYAAHVNHNIRGSEAKRDELFVKEFCDRRNIPFCLLCEDVPALARKRGTGIEETARNVRYDYFKSLSEKYGALVATAHNADDNAETVIYNLARGSGLKGLCGIPPKRGYIIRPLITAARCEIEQYCRENGVAYVTDSTNLEDEYSRNRIRHKVIPVLRDINPSLESAVTNAAELLRQDEEYLSSLAARALDGARRDNGYLTSMLSELPAPILSRAVMRAAFDCAGIRLDNTAVKSICEAIKSGGRVNVSGDLFADANSGLFRLYRKTAASPSESRRILGADEVKLNGRRAEFTVIPKKEFDKRLKFNNLLFKYSLDYDIINADTVIRARRSGDSFSPYKRGFTKSVKKFLIDEKIPREQRDGLLLIANGNGVLWLERFGASRQAAVSSKTDRVLVIKIS